MSKCLVCGDRTRTAETCDACLVWAKRFMFKVLLKVSKA